MCSWHILCAKMQRQRQILSTLLTIREQCSLRHCETASIKSSCHLHLANFFVFCAFKHIATERQMRPYWNAKREVLHGPAVTEYQHLKCNLSRVCVCACLSKLECVVTQTQTSSKPQRGISSPWSTFSRVSGSAAVWNIPGYRTVMRGWIYKSRLLKQTAKSKGVTEV